MKLVLFILSFIISFNGFTVGGKGPLDLHKEALKNKKPVVLDKIGIDEHLGDQLDLSLPFVDDAGKDVTLGKYFGKKAVFLMLIYYECPTLCSLHLNSLMKTFKDFEWQVGNEFDFVAISIDPDENYRLAANKKAAYLKEYGREETKDGWHFLTGTEESIKKITSQIGFKYAWDPREEQWAHSAAAYIVTPEGRLSYYHYGIQIQPKVLRLSLVEAASEKIGTIVDRVMLFCLQYDPDKKTYAFYAFNIMRVGGFIFALILGIFLFSLWRKEKK